MRLICDCKWMGCIEVEYLTVRNHFHSSSLSNCVLLCSRARYAHKILSNTATHVLTLFGSSQFIIRSHLRSEFSALLTNQSYPFTKQNILSVAVTRFINWFKNKPLSVFRFAVFRTFIKKLFNSLN